MYGVSEFRKNEEMVAAYAAHINDQSVKSGLEALKNTFCSPTSPMHIKVPGIALDQVAAFLLGVSCGRHQMVEAVQTLAEAEIEVEMLKETYTTQSEE